MKTRWVATELCKHFLPPLPLGKQNLKETKNQKKKKKRKLQHAVKKNVKPQNKSAPNRSSAPPGFVKNWLTLSGGQCHSPRWRLAATGLEGWALWPSQMGGGPGLWAKLQGNRPPSLLAPRLLPPLPDSSFLSGVRLGPREVMPASFCKSTGPWLYGDSEAHTEYVQNDFFTSKVERHPFDKGPFGEGYRGKLRVSFVPKAAAGSWRRA